MSEASHNAPRRQWRRPRRRSSRGMSASRLLWEEEEKEEEEEEEGEEEEKGAGVGAVAEAATAKVLSPPPLPLLSRPLERLELPPLAVSDRATRRPPAVKRWAWQARARGRAEEGVRRAGGARGGNGLTPGGVSRSEAGGSPGSGRGRGKRRSWLRGREEAGRGWWVGG